MPQYIFTVMNPYNSLHHWSSWNCRLASWFCWGLSHSQASHFQFFGFSVIEQMSCFRLLVLFVRDDVIDSSGFHYKQIEAITFAVRHARIRVLFLLLLRKWVRKLMQSLQIYATLAFLVVRVVLGHFCRMAFVVVAEKWMALVISRTDCNEIIYWSFLPISYP